LRSRELDFGRALELAAVQMECFDATLRRNAIFEQSLEHVSWDPNDAPIFTDGNAELDRALSLVPTCIFGK
jgi:hypothetical protein